MTSLDCMFNAKVDYVCENIRDDCNHEKEKERSHN